MRLASCLQSIATSPFEVTVSVVFYTRQIRLVKFHWSFVNLMIIIACVTGRTDRNKITEWATFYITACVKFPTCTGLYLQVGIAHIRGLLPWVLLFLVVLDYQVCESSLRRYKKLNDKLANIDTLYLPSYSSELMIVASRQYLYSF